MINKITFKYKMIINVLKSQKEDNMIGYDTCLDYLKENRKALYEDVSTATGEISLAMEEHYFNRHLFNSKVSSIMNTTSLMLMQGYTNIYKNKIHDIKPFAEELELHIKIMIDLILKGEI